MLSTLTREAILHLRAAEGWVELTNPAEALLELEAIAPEERSHPAVLEMFWHVYVAWRKWQPAFEVANQLIESHPEGPSGWINRAYAVRRMKGGGLIAAFDALLAAHKGETSDEVAQILYMKATLYTHRLEAEQRP